eukprot:966777-Prorocentrum_minimum.AAC.3
MSGFNGVLLSPSPGSTKKNKNSHLGLKVRVRAARGEHHRRCGVAVLPPVTQRRQRHRLRNVPVANLEGENRGRCRHLRHVGGRHRHLDLKPAHPRRVSPRVKVDRRLLLALTLTNRNGGVGVPHARDENVPVSKQPVNNQ